jgi:hypothetical protein
MRPQCLLLLLLLLLVVVVLLLVQWQHQLALQVTTCRQHL